MLADFNLSDSFFSYYGFFNWICVILSALLFLYIFLYKRYLFIKPSIMLLCYSHIFFQWPAAWYAGFYKDFLSNAYTFAFLIHGYVIIGLFISSATFNQSAKTIWARITDPKCFEKCANIKAILFLSLFVIAVAAFYLRYVPFSETGIYAIFNDPLSARIVREESLKLLENPFVQYAYSIMRSSVAPLLSVMLFSLCVQAMRKKKVFKTFAAGALILCVIISVSFSGSRSAAVNILFVMFLAFIFSKGLTIRPIYLFCALLLILSPAVLLTILREGGSISLDIIPEYFGWIGYRIFGVPLYAGSLFVHYVQEHGYFGVAGISKLAPLFGINPIDTPNLIGIHYLGVRNLSVSATSGYVFLYYSFFGGASLFVSIMGVWILDVALLVYGKLKDDLLLPCVASVSLATLAFISSGYTTTILTHGFGIILILSLIIDHMIRVHLHLREQGQEHSVPSLP